MKIRGPIFFSILFVGLLVAAYFPTVKNAEKEAILMQTLLDGLNQLHYQPQKIDDDFSEKVYDIYLDKLDGSRRFLTQVEVAQLEAYRQQLDEEANAGTFEFFDLSMKLMENGLARAQKYYRAYLEQPFDFSVAEGVELSGEKRDFAKDEAELEDYWRKFMKYETMVRLNQKIEDQEEKEAGEETMVKGLDEMGEEARAKVLEIYDDIFRRLNRLKRSDWFSDYLDAFANVYDPHTGYFKPLDKENFDMRLSGQYEGIGARLLEEGDYTKVTEVMVGGPAWKGKQLSENDMIMKVAQGDEEPVDIQGMLTNEVVKLIRGKKGTEVQLTVKKLDGTIAVIPITRDVVIMEEQYAKSLILDGSVEGTKVGYIQLPTFYANFNNRKEGRSCAKDISVELSKLKAEGVSGIILDLRFNGGGSLYDVVKMSGFFIEKGPVVQVKSRTHESQVLNDKDPGVEWDGPLVVMVNNFSASASEILAAALQDYDRAVIVGSNSTFGKGTVQRFIDLDRAVMGLDNIKPLGQVKLTIQKYYRVDGGSVQLKGVSPDIILPDNYYYLQTGEKEEKFPMKWTEIEPAKFDQDVFVIDSGLREDLKKNSKTRVAANPVFQKILQNAERLKAQREFTNYPLKLDEYDAYLDGVEEKSENFKKLFEEKINGGIRNLHADLEYIAGDDTRKARNKEFIETVSKDVYIDETINIISDLIMAATK